MPGRSKAGITGFARRLIEAKPSEAKLKGVATSDREDGLTMLSISVVVRGQVHVYERPLARHRAMRLKARLERVRA